MAVRVLGATGKMFDAAWIVPVVEARISFNGRTERRIEIAKSLDENPNGLLFLRKVENLDWTWLSDRNQIEYIGNISTEVVREALSFMLTNGFYNFSDWDYQKTEDLGKIVLDNGKSRPYSSAITRYAICDLFEGQELRADVDGGWELVGAADGDKCEDQSFLRLNEELDDEADEEFLDDNGYDVTDEDIWGDWNFEE